MAFLRFSHVAVSCQDRAAVERFYTKHFGFKRARVIGDDVLFLKSDTAYLELFHAEGEAPLPPAGADGPHYPGVRHLAFQVDDVDAKLAAIGDDARITLGPLSFDAVIPGWRTAWIADPEGNVVEISQGYVDEENPPAL
jgi:glyoxylase I family protein